MSVLEKKLSELTDADKDALTKYLGTQGRPFPMVGLTEVETDDGEVIMTRRLGVIEDDENPIEVVSERDYAEVVGMAMRNMPTPGMLPAFYDGLLRRRMDSQRRIQFVKGDPGSGKSFMGSLIGGMRSKKGAMVIDCGGKNLSELLYETVLDLDSDSRFYAELDRRLADDNVSPLTKTLLKDGLEKAVTEKEDGTLVVDWAKVGRKDGMMSSGTDSKAIEKALKALEKVRSVEGMDSVAANALGMATQEGPLIVAYREGREIVLDEYNKSKAGTDDGLQGVLQFLAGEIDEHTVENKLKSAGGDVDQEFSFRREDMKPGFFVTMTGNATEDGVSTRSLSKSVHSRIEPQIVPLASVEDWQHRICQIMTGLPISTLFRSSEIQWRKEPELFTKKLLEWRTLGMTDAEKRNIPDHHFKMIENWQNVLNATEKLAKFYHAWSQSVDPESDLMQKSSMAKVRMEVEDFEEYTSEVSIDFRKIIQHIEEATAIKSKVVNVTNSGGYDSDDWSKPPQLGKITREEPELGFGTRLVEVILSKVAATSSDRGMNHLYDHMMGLATQYGLRAIDLKEGTAAKQQMVGDMLNINEFKDKRPSTQFRLMQKLVADEVRSKNPKISALDDEIITRTQLERAADAMERLKPISSRENVLTVPNSDVTSLRGKPFLHVKTQDSMPVAGGQKASVATERLVDAETVLATLVVPRLGAANIKALFSKGLSGTGVTSTEKDVVVDEALAIAEGASKTGLKVTSVTAKVDRDGKAVPSHLHIFHDSANERTVIIGDKISDKMTRLFKRAGVTYVDRTDNRSSLTARRALEGFLKGRDAEQKQAVKDAFLYRVEARVGTEVKDAQLSDLVVSKDVQVFLPHYLTAEEVTPKADRKRPVLVGSRARINMAKPGTGTAPRFDRRRKIKAPRI
ncbi:MAG: hypothetical protein Alpg2KO_07740 [Alphaproteobacteria bacterium]